MRHVADVVPRLFGIRGVGGDSVLLCEHASPMLGDRGRIAVNFQPHQRIAKPMAMCQRTLHAWMCAQVAKASLKHERLAQPFDVAACERQLSQLERWRLSRLAVT